MEFYANLTHMKHTEKINLWDRALRLVKMGAWELDVGSGDMQWSPEVYHFYGLEEGVPTTLQSFLAPYSPMEQAKLMEALNESIEKGRGHDIVILNSRVPDQRQWVRVVGEPIEEGGAITRVYGTIQDITEQKHFEMRIRESEDRFWNIALSSSGWLWEVDSNFRYTYSSASIKTILGFDEKDIIGKTPFDLMTHEEAERVKLKLESSIANRDPIVDLQNWNLDATGKKVLLLTNGIPFYNMHGEFAGYRGVDRDITAQHYLEERLKNKEYLLKEIKIARWELDLVSGYLQWSPGIYEIFELDPKQFEPSYEAFLQVIHPQDRAKVDKAYRDSLLTKAPYSVVHRLLMKDGRTKWVREQCNTVFNEDDEPLRSMGIVQDISELQATQEELIRKKTYLESVQQSLDASTIVSITDKKGIILRANRKFCQVSQFTEEELLGKRHNIINSGHHPREFWKEMWQTISKGKTWRAEVKNRAKDGTEYWVDTTINPILDQNGEIIEYFSIRNLITDKKVAEFALESERRSLASALDLINQEIEFAESLQNYLLPSPPDWKEFHIKVFTLFKPLDRVSGDIYDFFQLTPTKFRFFIADATGHGLKAGFQTMSIQTEYQRIKDEYQDPARVLMSLNQSIHKTFPTQPIYYTCCLLDIDILEKTLVYASAGHPEPILFQGDRMTLLDVTSPILGMMRDPKIHSKKIPLHDRFRLVLYTDGITETHNKDYEVFDTDGVMSFMEKNKSVSQKAFANNLMRDLTQFRGDLNEFDDSTMIIVDFAQNEEVSE